MSTRQTSLLALGEAQVPAAVGPIERTDLGKGSWIDHQSQWLPGADAWFDDLMELLSWSTMSRPMYDRMVDVPRLITNYRRADLDTPPQLESLARVFDRHYHRRFPRIGLNLYRDGRDSVAWHSDKVRSLGDSIVAIVSLGERRPFQIRPIAGGPSHKFILGDGDLLVMGGTFQAFWQHTVPKVPHAGERVSIMFRGVGQPGRELLQPGRQQGVPATV